MLSQCVCVCVCTLYTVQPWLCDRSRKYQVYAAYQEYKARRTNHGGICTLRGFSSFRLFFFFFSLKKRNIVPRPLYYVKLWNRGGSRAGVIVVPEIDRKKEVVRQNLFFAVLSVHR